MPSCFLILQRFFLRVDDVLFRINDTRVYHEFGTPYVVREYTSKEQNYNSIKKVKKKKKKSEKKEVVHAIFFIIYN